MYLLNAHSNSPGYSTPVISVNSPTVYTMPNSITFPQLSVYLLPLSKNNEVRGTFEVVLDSLLVAKGLPQFSMGNISPPSSFSPTSTDSASLNTQSTSTPSPSLPDKPSTASSDDHSAPPARIYLKKRQKTNNGKSIRAH